MVHLLEVVRKNGDENKLYNLVGEIVECVGTTGLYPWSSRVINSLKNWFVMY